MAVTIADGLLQEKRNIWYKLYL